MLLVSSYRLSQAIMQRVHGAVQTNYSQEYSSATVQYPISSLSSLLKMFKLLVRGRGGSFYLISLVPPFIKYSTEETCPTPPKQREKKNKKQSHRTHALSCAAFGDLAALADPPLESFLHHNFLPYLFELPAQPPPRPPTPRRRN